MGSSVATSYARSSSSCRTTTCLTSNEPSLIEPLPISSAVDRAPSRARRDTHGVRDCIRVVDLQCRPPYCLTWVCTALCRGVYTCLRSGWCCVLCYVSGCVLGLPSAGEPTTGELYSPPVTA